jgi:membrane associated rhomboid family serine protease
VPELPPTFGPNSTWFEVARTRDRRKAHEHGLVLHSVGIPSGSMQAEGTWLLLVRPQDAERARAELARYEQENVGWPPRESHPAPISEGYYAALGYATLLGLLFAWERNGAFGLPWRAAGRSSAELVSAGEWWRAITALTLHADLQHVLGNIVFGVVFGVILAQSIGVGLAWSATLLAGALGNLVNAWIQSPEHNSIGASTAVFGALGVQAAYEWMKRKELPLPRIRRWAPIIGAVALLGWLGAGASFREGATTRENLRTLDQALEQVDVMAHVTGFGAGLAIGALLALREKRWRVAARWHWIGTLAPLAVIAAAWAIAFARTG